jgi:hypothetical protein
MPWVVRESLSRRARTRRRVRYWLDDHSEGVREAAFGTLCAVVVVGALKVAGLI